MEQVVAYKVVDKIQLKHLYLVYCISNATAEKKKEDFCLPFVNRCLCSIGKDHMITCVVLVEMNMISFPPEVSVLDAYIRAYTTNTDLIT